jgi:hypothetical protein
MGCHRWICRTIGPKIAWNDGKLTLKVGIDITTTWQHSIAAVRHNGKHTLEDSSDGCISHKLRGDLDECIVIPFYVFCFVLLVVFFNNIYQLDW